MLIEEFPDEDHGHGVEFAVAKQGCTQGITHGAVAEHQFVVGCEGRAAVGYGHVAAHVLEYLIIDDADAEQITHGGQQMIWIFYMA